MAAEAFHPFNRLPAELRYKIWEFAIFPHGRSAHFLTVVTSSGPVPVPWLERLRRDIKFLDPSVLVQQFSRLVWGDCPGCLWRTQSIYPLCHPEAPGDTDRMTREKQCLVVAPSCRKDLDSDCPFDGNPSAYTVDGGLWNACQESRWVIAQRYKYDENRAVTPTSRSDDGPESGDDSKLCCFRSDGGDVRNLLVRRTDLVVLRVRQRDVDAVDWKRLLQKAAFAKGHGRGVRHVALEIDPAWEWEADFYALVLRGDLWMQPGYGGILGAVARALYQMPAVRKFWLIDYSLRPQDPESRLAELIAQAGGGSTTTTGDARSASRSASRASVRSLGASSSSGGGDQPSKYRAFRAMDRTFIEVRYGDFRTSSYWNDHFKRFDNLNFPLALMYVMDWISQAVQRSGARPLKGPEHFGLLACEFDKS